MFASIGISVSVLDYGQYAGDTSGACFWLCLAAGLAAINADVLGQAVPAEHTARTLLEQLRMEDVDHPVTIATRHSVLGRLAESPRLHFCSGSTAVLKRADVKKAKPMQRLLPWQSAGRNERSCSMHVGYKSWRVRSMRTS